MGSQKESFIHLQKLIGKWKEQGGTTLVDFRISAHGSILVETWTWPEKEVEALTIYFMDDQKLMATHYCPIGNQPTLAFAESDDDSKFEFQFVSASNLLSKTDDHNMSFWFRLIDSSSFIRSETYLDKGTPEITEHKYIRQASD